MEVVPDEINRQCLICMPYHDFPTVLSVCRSWKAEIERPEFRRDRKAAGHSQNVVVMAQVRVDNDVTRTPPHQLTVFEPSTNIWRELPPIPGSTGRLPMFCGLVAVGWDLVVIGGWHPDTWVALGSVFVYNFLSARWRRGSDMPGGPRSLFGCSSDSDRTVYITGGHDVEKNAMRSALSYDVATDTWLQLPDMARERDECKGAFHRGKIHVIGGYGSEGQGRFRRCAEEFDVGTLRWGPVDEDFLPAGECPKNYVSHPEGELYSCHKGDVVVLRGGKWEVVTRLPEVSEVAFMTTWLDGLLVMGPTESCGANKAYVLRLKELTWAKLETPERFSGHVVSGCCLEI